VVATAAAVPMAAAVPTTPALPDVSQAEVSDALDAEAEVPKEIVTTGKRGRPSRRAKGGFRGGIRGRKKTVPVPSLRKSPRHLVSRQSVRRGAYKGPHIRTSPSTSVDTSDILSPPSSRVPNVLEDSSPGTPGSPKLSSTREEQTEAEWEARGEPFDDPEPNPQPDPPTPSHEFQIVDIISPGTMRSEGLQQVASGLETGNLQESMNGVNLVKLAVQFIKILIVLFLLIVLKIPIKDGLLNLFCLLYCC
jgi:hypothetical protein